MKIIDTFPKKSTLENLQIRFSGSYEAAIKYGKYVIVAAYTWDKDARDMICVGAVYSYATGNNSIEGPVKLLKESEIFFEDEGHAIEWGFNLAKLLTDVVAAFEKEG